ncbi:LysR substrate-binding domain-containing protein [Amaricoccus sp. W119]|uniref:LysR substrate-binding domain-containing protein n=1 Tax=Amaricoccus sp. W119 TaxID=3391833 RepID=UPI0039A74F9F
MPRPNDVLMPSRQRYNDLDAVLDAAVEGGGLAWLPRWLAAPRVAESKLQLVMDGSQPQPMDFRAVWPRSKFLPRRTRAVIDALVAEVPKMMG